MAGIGIARGGSGVAAAAAGIVCDDCREKRGRKREKETREVSYCCVHFVSVLLTSSIAYFLIRTYI